MSKSFVAHGVLSLCTGQSVRQGLTLWNWADASAPTTTLDLHPFREKRVFRRQASSFHFSLIYISSSHNELSAYTWQRLLVFFLRLFESLLDNPCKR